jgi:hypothetical protein
MPRLNRGLAFWRKPAASSTGAPLVGALIVVGAILCMLLMFIWLGQRL